LRYKTVLFDSNGHNSVSSPFPEISTGIKIINRKKHKRIKIKKQGKTICAYCTFVAFMENLLAKGMPLRDKFVLYLHLAHKTVVRITARFSPRNLEIET
jgi:hypothetical protein